MSPEYLHRSERKQQQRKIENENEQAEKGKSKRKRNPIKDWLNIFWKERKMFGIKIHKIPSTKDNDNTNVLHNIDDEIMWFRKFGCLYCYHVVNRPTSYFLVVSLLPFHSHTLFISMFWCCFTLFIFSCVHRCYYCYFVSPKWNIFITNITFIILAWLHTLNTWLYSPPPPFSPVFLLIYNLFSLFYLLVYHKNTKTPPVVLFVLFSRLLCVRARVCVHAFVRASFLFISRLFHILYMCIFILTVYLFTFVSSFLSWHQ